MARNIKGVYISYTTLLVGCAIVIVLGLVYVAYLDLSNKQMPDINVQVLRPPQPQLMSTNFNTGDDRYTRAPKPERDWMSSPDLSVLRGSRYNLPSIPTRGIPETYQQMGVLRVDDGSVLPLYGRPTASRSDRYQYYSRTDTYNPVQLPIRYNNRDCTDDVGCNELYSGDSVSLAPSGKRGEVTLYRLSGPTYIPI